MKWVMLRPLEATEEGMLGLTAPVLLPCTSFLVNGMLALLVSAIIYRVPILRNEACGGAYCFSPLWAVTVVVCRWARFLLPLSLRDY